MMMFQGNCIGKLTIVALGCLVASGCAGSHKQRERTTTIDQDGVRVLAILAQYLFPPTWEEATQVSIARRMLPLEYHGDTYMGKTLIQSKVSFDKGALQKLLVDTKRTTPSFTSTTDFDHAFGKESHSTGEGIGAGRQLSWWEPGKHKDATYYFWGHRFKDRPQSRVWLQVSEGKKGTETVYIRIESE